MIFPVCFAMDDDQIVICGLALGHADPDVIGEQNSIFTVRSGTNELGPLTTTGSNGWKAASPWHPYD
jgi:hypothetical protein